MIRYSVLILVWILSYSVVRAQTASGLSAYFSFDDCLLLDETGLQSDAVPGNPGLGCTCSPIDSAIFLNGGANDFLTMSGNYGQLLNRDFTLSFYFIPENTGGLVDILSVADSCGGTGMYITYIPVNQSVIFEIETDGGARRDLSATIDLRSCWQNVVITRESNRYTMYINGVVEAAEEVRLNFDMSPINDLRVANSICLNAPGQLQRLQGAFDELRVYNRALNSNQVAALYVSPDKVFTTDTLIFTGDFVQVRSGKSCAPTIQWSPVSGVSDPGILNPILSPARTQLYTVTVNYGRCLLRDSLLVLVTDKDSLDCENLLLPSAFSPNGDGLNDEFRISNPFLIDELTHWSIFDRTGAVLFETNNPLEGWDGNFNGNSIPPALFGYRLEYQCKNETFQKIGSFYLMR